MARKDANRGKREAALERRLKAYELRKAGAVYRQIAEQLGISETQAYRDVIGRMRQLAKLEEAEVPSVRQLELDRLDGLLLRHYPTATGGDLEATRTVLAILKRRAELLGLDKALPLVVQSAAGGPVVIELVWQSPETSPRALPPPPEGPA